MTGSSTARALGALAFLLSAGVAGAQDPSALKEQPLPRDLFEGLLAAFGRPQSTVVVGELPPQLKTQLFVPRGAKVVGGSYTTAQSYAVITLEARPESIAALYSREMAKGGWTLAPTATQAVGGFANATSSVGPSTPVPGAPTVYCSNGSAITMRTDYQGLGVTRLLFSTYPTYPQCQQLGRQAVSMGNGMPGTIISQSSSMSSFRPHPLPILINPAAAPMTPGTCPNDNMTIGGPSTELSTSLSADQLFEHYGKQMADSGWKPLGPLAFSRTWTRTDSAGNRSDATLTIRTAPEVPNCRRISADLKGRKR